MQLSLAKEHRDFFQKNGWIEFSSILQTADLAKAIDAALSTDKSVARDLWRNHPLIKKVALKRDFAQVAADLSKQREIRIGFDQLLGAETPRGMISLQQMSCVRPIVMGLLIRLTEGPMPEKGKFPCPCPTSPGDGVFFSSSLLLSWDPLLDMRGQRFYLIAYASANTQYILEKRDPFTHALKHLGYGFGDALSTDTHPFILN